MSADRVKFDAINIGDNMSAQLKGVVTIYNKLTAEWNKKDPNLVEVGNLLALLKVKLTQCQNDFLPTDDTEIDLKHVMVARGTLEIGAQWAIAKKDAEAFERYMAQLKTYYLDYSVKDLTESTYKHQLLGLNLLRLLAQNRLADFHTELELLSTDDMQKNVYIKHPVQMEQYLMEGSYNKVFMSRENTPAASYKFFMEILLKTIRDEIAGCIEKAYEKIGFQEAARMLFIGTSGLDEYLRERHWVREPNTDMIYFQKEEKIEEYVPAIDLVKQTITYARELEMIV